MIGLLNKNRLLIMIAFGLFLLLPGKALAAKSLTMSSNTTSVEADKVIETKVYIDVSDSINAIQFKLDFPTELLEIERFTPNTAIFDINFAQGATTYQLGKSNSSFTGTGLVATIAFRGRVAGDATIGFGEIKAAVNTTGQSSWLTGFETNSLNLIVYGQGAAPPPPVEVPKPTTKPTTSTPGTSETLPGLSPTVQPGDTSAPSIKDPSLEQPDTVSGSKTEVIGPMGSQNEEPLKQDDGSVSANNPSVKGLFTEGNGIYYGFFPTLLLMLLVVYLGIKLFFTEKRRHLEVEKIFDSELSALSALESKIDIFDQKGEGAKEKFMAEFEETKNKIMSEVGATIKGK